MNKLALCKCTMTPLSSPFELLYCTIQLAIQYLDKKKGHKLYIAYVEDPRIIIQKYSLHILKRSSLMLGLSYC